MIEEQQIVVKLSGGLGNQLFQYAVGRSLAIRNQRNLRLDRRFLDGANNATYGLHQFNIDASLSGIEDGIKRPPLKRDHKIAYYLWRHLRLAPKRFVERNLSFEPRLLEPISNIYLEGYWQSERYFSDIAETIRNDLKIITTPSQQNAEVLEKIYASPAVSLHVRRGDYLHPVTQAVHGSCKTSYYLNAVRLIAEKTKVEPVVYAFSDEPEWVRENLRLPFETHVVSHNGPDKNYEDLRLMSACRHHVIANSSFSWWGAWLNASTSKVVVAPIRWFADPSLSNPDIVPTSWQRLEN